MKSDASLQEEAQRCRKALSKIVAGLRRGPFTWLQGLKDLREAYGGPAEATAVAAAGADLLLKRISGMKLA